MYLLDVQYSREDSTITCWIKKNDTCFPLKETYHPEFYVSGGAELRSLAATIPGVVEACFTDKRTHLRGAPERLIAVKAKSTEAIYDLAGMLEARGCTLYNIDLDPARQYLFSRNLFPMADLDSDERYSMDYAVPQLKAVELSVKPNKHHGIITMDDNIGSITLGENILEGDEDDMLTGLNSLIASEDPDIIATNGGDSFDLPYLYHRATKCGVSLQLGRMKDVTTKSARSYFSYGRILYKPQGYILSGRLHLDRSSFMYREGGLAGLIDLSRITGIPMQELRA